MIVKKHVSDGRLILAVCDKELLGKKIEDSSIILDLNSHFYKGEAMSKDEVIKLIKKAYIVNAVGNNSISLLIQCRLMSRGEAKVLKEVPYIQLIIEDHD